MSIPSSDFFLIRQKDRLAFEFYDILNVLNSFSLTLSALVLLKSIRQNSRKFYNFSQEEIVMKKKEIIHFDINQEELWIKGFRKYNGVHFILLSEMPTDEILYAATIDSNLEERYEKNQLNEVESIALAKQKGDDEKFLQILMVNGKTVTLKKEDYFLIFHLFNNEETSEDYVLIFNKPNMLGKGAHYQIFPSDTKDNNAMSLFWMLKDFISKGKV